jgi:predicted nuclease of predicted toxin-antitoxin system
MIVAELQAEAVHVMDIGLTDAPYAALWKFATQREFILISKDEDFARIALHDTNAGLIWVRPAPSAHNAWQLP